MSGNVNLKRYKLVGLDTNIFVYYFERHPRFGPRTKTIFDLLSQNKLTAVTSLISLTELLSVPASATKIEGLKNLFLSTPNLNSIELNQIIALGAAKIRRDYSFRLPDSIQLATALHTKAQVFITNDRRLKRFKELSILLLSEIK